MSAQPLESSVAKGSSPVTPGRSADFDLEEQIEILYRDGEWQNGVARKVLVAYPDFQIVLRTMRAGAKISEHHNSGRISVQTLRGYIRMHADGRLFDLPAETMLVLDRAVTHDVEAVEESAFLLTVARPEPR